MLDKRLFKGDSLAQDQADLEAPPVTLDDLDEELAKKLRENKSGNVLASISVQPPAAPASQSFPTLWKQTAASRIETSISSRFPSIPPMIKRR